MINWIVKLFAFLTAAALIIGMAAECVTLIGDMKSVGTTPTTKASSTFGIMLAVKADKKSSSKAVLLVCEAYKHNTDFNQRGGAIFHAALYHLLTLIAFTLMLVQQTLRGFAPASLGMIYRFVPALSTGWGLSTSGGFMIYVGLQILSYSVGTVHVAAALLLMIAGFLNIVAGFYPPLASCDGLDPFAGGMRGGMMGDPYGDSAGGGMYGDEFGGPPGAMGPPGDGGDAPDPYDGKDPNEVGNALEHDGADGVGASAPPPGVIAAEEKKTFGVPPAGMAPLNGYGQVNAETNPALVAGAQYGLPAGAAGTSEVVFDPATGMWNTVFRPAPAPAVPQQALLQPAAVPVGFDAFGRAIMGQPPGLQGWPGIAMPQQAVAPAENPKDAKKAARKEARKEYNRQKEEEREAERAARREEEKKEERRIRRREKERERAIRKQEKRVENAAREMAAEDAQERMKVEQAEEDARRRQSAQVMKERRAQAINDARKQAIERERAYRTEEEAMLAAQREQWEHQQRQEAQTRALTAARNAVDHGAPLRDRESYLSRASTMPNGASRPASEIFEEADARRRSSSVPVPPIPEAYMSQRQSRHPAFLTPAVPLAPLPGQRSHLSTILSQPSGRGITHSRSPQQPPNSVRTPVTPLSHEQRAHFPHEDVEVEELPYSAMGRPASDAMSEKELLWTRMQEERERVLAQQAMERGEEVWRESVFDRA